MVYFVLFRGDAVVEKSFFLDKRGLISVCLLSCVRGYNEKRRIEKSYLRCLNVSDECRVMKWNTTEYRKKVNVKIRRYRLCGGVRESQPNKTEK